MSAAPHVWLIDGDSALKRRVRIEVIGKSFTLYEQQWRSDVYFFGDLVYRGKQGDSHVFGLEDGIRDRPKWKLGFKGEVPAELVSVLPRAKTPLLSNIGMLVIAFLCLAIVYFAAT
ncbi:hypothetical protein [Sphingorhabdus sp. 109]|jgi:hypothetical protein|uniref:hypothetical protein n=1 Tax=Sphingorhabdus sp. 109 TaxID=2653173 RepID=UPI0012F05FBD|nr:hypothetical protein [Sphingorhabdus sp. 109]VWX59160.1 conserved hypothetical protein [Sphingorhabdus sp. 109]